LSRKLPFLIATMLVAVVTLVAVIRVRYPGKATIRLPASECDADLWKHIGEPERLHVIAACASVEGQVVSLYRASDGDLHIELDPHDKSVLNFVNLMHSHGHLVVEIICEHTPEDAASVAACAGLTSQVMIPHINDYIRVTGSYVTDRENGWNEIHPVTRIRKLI
jgi:hypothetical protein